MAAIMEEWMHECWHVLAMSGGVAYLLSFNKWVEEWKICQIIYHNQTQPNLIPANEWRNMNHLFATAIVGSSSSLKTSADLYFCHSMKTSYIDREEKHWPLL